MRIHGETHKRPVELFVEEQPCLHPAPVQSYDIASTYAVRASSRFRVSFDANRYSVPAEYAGRPLTLKA